MRRIVAPLVIIISVAILAWLCAIEASAARWVLPGAAVVLIVGTAVRAARAPRSRRLRSALAPAADALEGMQDIYLARPGIGVEHAEDPPVPTLIDDRAVPDLIDDHQEPLQGA